MSQVVCAKSLAPSHILPVWNGAFTYWCKYRHDKELVKFLCTMASVVDQEEVVKRIGGRVAAGEPFEVKEVKQPLAIFLYNLYMGG